MVAYLSSRLSNGRGRGGGVGRGGWGEPLIYVFLFLGGELATGRTSPPVYLMDQPLNSDVLRIKKQLG